MTEWKSMNYDKPIPDVTKPFSITCPSGTDIYDIPPSTHRFNAPVIYATTTAGAFKSVAVTVTGDWKQKYDQGGLCLIMKFNDGTTKWIKTGIEFLEGTPQISVVTSYRWADWSLRPLLNTASRSARVQIESGDDGHLWVYVVGEDGEKQPVREVTWWGELEADTQVQVGPAAAKPSTEAGNLIVDFSNFELSLV